jgi:ribosomal protein S12 methylthiotransferase
MAPGKNRFFLYSLGCPKNLVDSEWLSGALMAAGWQPVSDPGEAALLLVNTCAFIEDAVSESIEAILSLRAEAPEARLAVTGCLPLRYGRSLRALLPEVETFFTCRRMDCLQERDVRRLIAGAGWMASRPLCGEAAGPAVRPLSSGGASAYVKIADGCNRRCAYCTIPAIRGKSRSRVPSDIVREVAGLSARGVREIILVAQDTAAYGADLPGDVTLAGLLETLAGCRGIQWIKVLYLYPDVRRVTDGLVSVFTRHPNLCPVVDVPIQHIAPGVLKRMRRPGPAAVQKVLNRLGRIPGIRFRTTVIVGFPGETREEFEALCRFVEEGWFYSLGAFAYSDEEGTAACGLPGKVPDAEKQARLTALMAAQQEVSARHNAAMKGETFPVLIEGEHEETPLLLKGRTAFQFPEIDGCVLVTEGTADAGEIKQVRITDAGPYDLVGGIVENKGLRTED